MNIRTIQIPNAVLIHEVEKSIRAGHKAKLRVKGNSMRLFLKSGRDLVLLDAVKPEDLRMHDVILARVSPRNFVLHRIIRMDGDRLTLMGDGNLAGVEHCTTADVIAKAEAFYRKGRSVPDAVTGWKWKLYSTVWLHLTPFRRYILGLVRRIPLDI